MTALAKKKKSMRLQAISYIGVVIAVLIDQFTKYLANAYLNGRQARVLIPGVFEFRYLENESAAFGVEPGCISAHQNALFCRGDAHRCGSFAPAVPKVALGAALACYEPDYSGIYRGCNRQSD